jgi:hypothetical protein
VGTKDVTASKTCGRPLPKRDCKASALPVLSQISAGGQGQLMQFDRTELIQALRRVVQRMHYPLEVMLVRVRWSAACPLSTAAIARIQAGSGLPIEMRPSA